VTIVITTASVVLAALLLGAVALLWRLYQDGVRRADAALAMVETERSRTREHQQALRRYEVAFASVSGRGELGEQVLVETARALGLREGLHFTVQTDLAGGGSARPDMVLLVGGGRQVPVDAKMSMVCWTEAVEAEDSDERADALRVHVRNIRARAAELAAKGYERWADAIYGTIMFVPSDAAVVAALDTDKDLLRWLLDRRVFLCGPTGFAVVASAALVAVDAVNLSSTHLQRFLSARRRELDALEGFRGAVQPLTDTAASPTAIGPIRRMEGAEMVGANSSPAEQTLVQETATIQEAATTD
jgi:DNA recombination protein RmuC